MCLIRASYKGPGKGKDNKGRDIPGKGKEKISLIVSQQELHTCVEIWISQHAGKNYLSSI